MTALVCREERYAESFLEVVHGHTLLASKIQPSTAGERGLGISLLVPASCTDWISGPCGGLFTQAFFKNCGASLPEDCKAWDPTKLLEPRSVWKAKKEYRVITPNVSKSCNTLRRSHLAPLQPQDVLSHVQKLKVLSQRCVRNWAYDFIRELLSLLVCMFCTTIYIWVTPDLETEWLNDETLSYKYQLFSQGVQWRMILSYFL